MPGVAVCTAPAQDEGRKPRHMKNLLGAKQPAATLGERPTECVNNENIAQQKHPAQGRG